MSETHAAVEDLDLLLETMIATEGMRTRDEALPLLCEKAAEILGCDAAMVRLVDQGETALHTAALAITSDILSPENLDIARNEVLTLAKLETHVIRRSALPPSVEAFLSGEMQVVTTTASTLFPIATMCAVPLVRRGRSLGVLALYWVAPHDPGEPERRLIRICARMAALVVEVTTAADRAIAEFRRLTSARQQSLLLLTQTDAAASAVRRAEELLGIDESSALELLVAESTDAEQSLAQSELLAGDLEDATVVASGTHVVALLATADVARVRPRLSSAPGFVGAGHTGPVRPGSFARAHQNATTATHISRARGGRMVAFNEVGSVLSITSGMPEKDARALVAEVLGPLEEYDRRHDSRLLDTLVAYLSENGSATATGRKLHLHVNTVKQRIERINELTGADVRDYAFVARLLLALEWRALLSE